MSFEGVAVLLGLVLLAIPVVVIWLAVSHLRLRDQVRRLERELAALAVRRAGDAADRAGGGLPLEALRPEVLRPEVLRPEVLRPDASVPDPTDPIAAEAGFPDGAPPDGDDTPLVASVSAATPANPWQAARGRPVGPTIPARVPPVRPSRLTASLGALGAWIAANWVYAVAAASLMAAGVFLLEYGIEEGLLPPAARVIAAFALGAALVAAGERIRGTRIGDEDGPTAFLPSTFSGAGLVVMFAALISARGDYGMIGPAVALVGLAGVAGFAVWLGWRHGPFLAALGLLGAAAAPFLTGGSADNADWLYGWFGIVAMTGLAVDTVRRWGWISALALGCGYGGATLFLAAGGGLGGALALWAALPLLAAAVPRAELVPTHPGPGLAEGALGRVVPSIPVLLAGAAMAVSSVLMGLTSSGAASGEAWLGLTLLAALAAGTALWTRAAPGLADLAAWPAAGFLGAVVLTGQGGGPLAQGFWARGLTVAELGLPWDVTALSVLGAVVTLAAAIRALAPAPQGPAWSALVWAGAAAIFAPAVLLALEVFWLPGAVIGAWPWAIHALVLAAGLTLFAERLARMDAPDRARAALAVLSVLSLLSLALFLILTKAPLTLALSAMLVAAAALDRRLGMPGLSLFVQVGVPVIGYRLLVDPGLVWAGTAPVFQVALAHIAPVAGCLTALALLRGVDRPVARLLLETGAAGFAGIAASVLLARGIEAAGAPGAVSSHWGLSLQGTIWLVVALVQLARRQLPGPLRWMRLGLAAVALVLAVSAYVGGLVLLSPLWTWDEFVAGPILLNTLLVAYALPAALMLGAAVRAPGLATWGRGALAVTGGALALAWAGLAIRHAWQGPDLSQPGVADGELYTYTIALIALGAGLLWQAIRTRSARLRRVAMTVIGLTAAKVFLIDADGLTGLTRVFSFLALGLSLAGLAWLNRWAAERGGPQPPPPPSA